MTRRSFDDGHQHPRHTSGFDLNFEVMHNLFHGHREENVGKYRDPMFEESEEEANDAIKYRDPMFEEDVVSDVARDEGISFDEAAGFVPDAIAEVDADNLENYDDYNDLGDLVDPQNDTYEEEGTHGITLAIGAAVKGYGKFRKTPAGKAVEAAAIEKGTEIAGKAMSSAKDKLADRRGAKSGPSGGDSTPDSDDPFA